MSVLRAFIVGVVLALAFVVAVYVSGDASGWVGFLALTPVAALLVVALETVGQRCGRRLARGLFGSALATGAAVPLVLVCDQLFPFPGDEHGALLYLSLLTTFAVVPAFVAAAPTRAATGRGLAVGFSVGLSMTLLAVFKDPGVPLLMAVGTFAGALVAHLPVGLPATSAKKSRFNSSGE